MKIWYDTEFLEDGKTIELISIGMVAEDGREYYAVNSEAPIEAIKQLNTPTKVWLVRNVLPSLPLVNRTGLDAYLEQPQNSYPKPTLNLVGLDTTDTRVKPRWVIANEVRDFIRSVSPAELWAWYAAYDHVALAQLWGPMIRLPEGVPMWTNDLRQEVARLDNPELPAMNRGDEHNALDDARELRARDEWLRNS